MRKIYTTILSVCICASAAAEAISVSDAGIHARKFFGAKSGMVPIASDKILGTREADAPTFFIINNPSGGWLILSGEDSSKPVLGYSDTGSFPTSGFSPATGELLSQLNEGIRNLRASKARQSETVKAQWASIGTKTKSGAAEVVLETAEWGQFTPFNNLCPKINSENALTGCTATAMAIVCRYHKWPQHGTGTAEAYSTDTRHIRIPASDLSSHAYNWYEMPLKYNGIWTSVQKSSVATLMYDCGVTVKMDYDLAENGGSGAMSSRIPAALINNFSYSGSLRMVASHNYDTNELLGTIKKEIDAGRPLIYSGLDKDGSGHAFVLDGYDERNMVHVNWGWNGQCNGFFALTWLGDDGDPNVSGNVGYVFNEYAEIVLGIEPDKSGKPRPEGAELFLYSSDSISGIKLKSGSLSGGNSFYLDIGYILNNSSDADYSGKFKIVLLDRSGNVKEDLSESKDVKIKKISGNQYNGVSVMDFSCRINGTVAPGDALAVMYTLPDGSWVRMGGDPEQKTISLYGIYDACFIANRDTYKANEAIYPSLIQGHVPIQKTDWYYDGRLMDKGFVVAEQGPHSIKAVISKTDGSTETVVHPLTVN